MQARPTSTVNQSQSRSYPTPLSASSDQPMHDILENDELDRSPTAASPAPSRKRKKPPESEPEPTRRLRRSHEACARCRLKKIKARIPQSLINTTLCLQLTICLCSRIFSATLYILDVVLAVQQVLCASKRTAIVIRLCLEDTWTESNYR